mmetsp:Transcript_29993/g.68793  ORF Transcript_29993/g.68793 Transcript_29993/m.68793 type:complete len:127 (-) Transcript_29993:16-396(-)
MHLHCACQHIVISKDRVNHTGRISLDGIPPILEISIPFSIDEILCRLLLLPVVRHPYHMGRFFWFMGADFQCDFWLLYFKFSDTYCSDYGGWTFRWHRILFVTKGEGGNGGKRSLERYFGFNTLLL